MDFLQRKRKDNEGELPQYYVEQHHEAIIEPRIFKLVQAEIKRGSPYQDTAELANTPIKLNVVYVAGGLDEKYGVLIQITEGLFIDVIKNTLSKVSPVHHLMY